MPRNKRRARSSSRPRDAKDARDSNRTFSGDFDSSDKRQNRKSLSNSPRRYSDDDDERSPATSELIHLSPISSSISYSDRNSSSSNSRSTHGDHSKITKEGSRHRVSSISSATSTSSARDFERGSQVSKSDRPRFYRAVSAPRELRSYKESSMPVLDENKSYTNTDHYRRQSHSLYEQLPERDTVGRSRNASPSPSTSSHRQTSSSTSSSYLLKSQQCRPDHRRQRSVDETGISMVDFNSNPHQRHHSSGGTSYASSMGNTQKPGQSCSYQDISLSGRSQQLGSSSISNHSHSSHERDSYEDGERKLRYSSRSSAEEPLLPRTQSASSSSSSSYRIQRQMSEGSAGLLPKQHIQTFPRMKQPDSISSSPPSYPVSSATVDRFKSGKTHFLLDRIRNITPNQLSAANQDPHFSPLRKDPSVSSTSSDARSDVCLDLPDQAEDMDADDDIMRLERRDTRIKLGFPDAPYNRLVHMTDYSMCRILWANVLGFFVSFVLVWPLLATVVIIVPVIYVIKRLCSWCCCCGRKLWGRCCLCLCHAHLTSSEMVWLGRQSRTNPVVQSLVVLQRGLDTERIRNLIKSRLLSVENRQGHKLYPRFTQKVGHDLM